MEWVPLLLSSFICPLINMHNRFLLGEHLSIDNSIIPYRCLFDDHLIHIHSNVVAIVDVVSLLNVHFMKEIIIMGYPTYCNAS